MGKIILLMALLATCLTAAPAQNRSAGAADKCYRWRTRVDPSLKLVEIDIENLNDDEVVEGIGCLLDLKGERRRARFYGDTKLNLNQSDRYRLPEKPATVEIAALFYASYLFYEKWEHANAVALYDDATGKINTGKLVEKAYKSYRKWYQQVRAVGLKAAREKKLDPLEGSGVSWS